MTQNLRGIQAQEKYVRFMKQLHRQKVFNRRAMENEYKISHQICTQLAKRGFILLQNLDEYRWVGNEPTNDLAIDILTTMRANNRAYAQRAKKSAPQQLTIKPIKRVERTQPVRVQEEPINDTSNSKVFIILAVGAMVGFLIATIIWK
jgi:hypothetical protein